MEQEFTLNPSCQGPNNAANIGREESNPDYPLLAFYGSSGQNRCLHCPSIKVRNGLKCCMRTHPLEATEGGWGAVGHPDFHVCSYESEPATPAYRGLTLRQAGFAQLIGAVPLLDEMTVGGLLAYLEGDSDAVDLIADLNKAGPAQQNAQLILDTLVNLGLIHPDDV